MSYISRFVSYSFNLTYHMKNGQIRLILGSGDNMKSNVFFMPIRGRIIQKFK